MIHSDKTEGIILKQRNCGEADRLLTVYTRKFGKMRMIAKGVRRIGSRKRGNLELFNNVSLVLVKGRNLPVIIEAAIANSYSAWKGNLLKVGIAYYFCELIDKLVPENEENGQVFALLKSALGRLEGDSLAKLVREFEKSLLLLLGYGIPREYIDQKDGLRIYIETIIEKRINSPEIVKKLLVDRKIRVD